jgi:hypothetical protein
MKIPKGLSNDVQRSNSSSPSRSVSLENVYFSVWNGLCGKEQDVVIIQETPIVTLSRMKNDDSDNDDYDDDDDDDNIESSYDNIDSFRRAVQVMQLPRYNQHIRSDSVKSHVDIRDTNNTNRSSIFQKWDTKGNNANNGNQDDSDTSSYVCNSSDLHMSYSWDEDD